MSPKRYLSEGKLVRKVIKLLTEKLDPLETSRFLSIANQKRIESVKRHRKWQDALNKDAVFKEILGK